MATNDKLTPLIEVIGNDTPHNDHNQTLPAIKESSNFSLSDKSNKQRDCVASIKSKLRRQGCLKSKPVVMILIWSFLAAMLHWIFTDPSSVSTPLTRFSLGDNYYSIAVIGSAYVYFAILQVFYPLAGYLADVRYGRQKCVIGSLCSFFTGTLLLGISGPLLVGCLISLPYGAHKWSYAVMSVIILFVGPLFVIGMFLFFSSIVAFNANVIQFGLDQLHNSPTEHLILFIHWYVLVSYFGTELIKIPTSTLTSLCGVLDSPTDDTDFNFVLSMSFVGIVSVFLIAMYLFLLVSLCVAFRKRHTWFLSDSGSRNPYRLVYKVISFAREHRNPVRRSAFTYCEDELPSRLDLGKEKYGGPFTTEQVEDVKAFIGIFKVLLTLGPLFAVERSINFLLPLFSKHVFGIFYPCSLSNKGLPSLIIILLLVLYIVLLRPLIQDYIPSVLKRIGLGMILMLTPIFCFFIFDTIGHATTDDIQTCFLTSAHTLGKSQSLIIKSALLLIPTFANISGSMIFYVAMYEFLYSQSPYSMKGLVIGTFFAIRGSFQLLGALVFIFPFLAWKSTSSFPSCGFIYYLVNMIVAFLGMIAFIWITKRYQNRQRDEPDNIYRYAEEYYEKAQEEPNYDYSDYDNLDVHTIS